MRHSRSIYLAVCVIVILSAAGVVIDNKVSGQSVSPAASTSQPANTSSTVAVGHPLALTGSGGLKAIVTINSVTDHPKAIGLIGQPSLNGQYAVADISIQVASGQYTYNAGYFNYQAANGQTYSWTDGNGVTAGYEPGFTFGTLSAGQSVRDNLTFDVPQGPGQDIQLRGPLGAVIGQWALS